LPFVLATWFVVISLNIFADKPSARITLTKIFRNPQWLLSSAALGCLFLYDHIFLLYHGIASLEASIFFINISCIIHFSGSKISSSANCCKVLWNLFSKAFLKYSNPSPGSYICPRIK
jgi:hypothetical protein